MWEVMTMLLRGSAEYITEAKSVCMLDLFPISESDKMFPSPRVLNTHYRLDVLPDEFRGRKTVVGKEKDRYFSKNIWSYVLSDQKRKRKSELIPSFFC